MADQARFMVSRNLPWRRGIAWWVLGAEGAILALIGIYVLVAPDSAREIVRQVFAWFLLINGGLVALAGLRAANLESPIPQYRMLTAGIGLTTGAIVVLDRVSDFIDDDGAKCVLAVGFIGKGVFELIGAALPGSAEAMTSPRIPVSSFILIMLGLLFLYNVRRDSLDIQWFGIAALVGGGIAMAYAFLLFRSAQPESMGALGTKAEESPPSSPRTVANGASSEPETSDESPSAVAPAEADLSRPAIGNSAAGERPVNRE